MKNLSNSLNLKIPKKSVSKVIGYLVSPLGEKQEITPCKRSAARGRENRHQYRRLCKKSKYFTTMFTKDFHKEHKEMNYRILNLCPLCIFSVLCGKKSLLRQPQYRYRRLTTTNVIKIKKRLSN